MSLPPLSPPPSSWSNNRQACAACKHQRRKCDPGGCVLARYFPAERGREFRSVHRHFGVSNLMRIYNVVPPHLRDHAMRSMTFEAEMRRRDPVHGCVGVVRALSAQIEAAQKELEVVLREIQLCRSSLQRIQVTNNAMCDGIRSQEDLRLCQGLMSIWKMKNEGDGEDEANSMDTENLV